MSAAEDRCWSRTGKGSDGVLMDEFDQFGNSEAGCDV